MQPADSDLLRDYAGHGPGSEGAFAELVARHVGLVFSAALRVTVDRQLAEDVTQTTFAILAREARHLVGRTMLASWLHRTASNQAAKLVRGEMRRRTREQEACAMQADENGSGSEAVWKQVAPQLDVALNRLAEGDRAVLLLRFFERKSAAEIGALLQVTEVAAQKRVTRALERLRTTLAGAGVSISSTALANVVAAQAVVSVPAGLSATVSASALAAGTVTTAALSFTTFKLILMSKCKIGVVSALVVAGVAAPYLLQQRQLAQMHQEVDGLRQQAREVETVKGERDDLARRLAEAAAKPGLAQSQLTELLRLRGEVGPLRRDSQELARLRTGQQAKSAPAGAEPEATERAYMPAVAWANVGAGAPDTAIQTFLWAGRHGETNLIGNLVRWQRDPEVPTNEEMDQQYAQALIGGTTHFAGELEGFRILDTKTVSDNEARLRVELTDSHGKVLPYTLRLVREDNQWFPVMHVWLDHPGSVRGSLEMPAKLAGTP